MAPSLTKDQYAKKFAPVNAGRLLIDHVKDSANILVDVVIETAGSQGFQDWEKTEAFERVVRKKTAIYADIDVIQACAVNLLDELLSRISIKEEQTKEALLKLDNVQNIIVKVFPALQVILDDRFGILIRQNAETAEENKKLHADLRLKEIELRGMNLESMNHSFNTNVSNIQEEIRNFRREVDSKSRAAAAEISHLRAEIGKLEQEKANRMQLQKHTLFEEYLDSKAKEVDILEKSLISVTGEDQLNTIEQQLEDNQYKINHILDLKNSSELRINDIFREDLSNVTRMTKEKKELNDKCDELITKYQKVSDKLRTHAWQSSKSNPSRASEDYSILLSGANCPQLNAHGDVLMNDILDEMERVEATLELTRHHLLLPYEFLISGTPHNGPRTTDVHPTVIKAMNETIATWKNKSFAWEKKSYEPRCQEVRRLKTNKARAPDHDTTKEEWSACNKCIRSRMPCTMNLTKTGKPVVLPLPVEQRSANTTPADLGYYVKE